MPSVESIDWASVLAWATIGLGALLTVKGVEASVYFYRQKEILDDNWVADVMFVTVLTITIGAGIITLLRAITLSYGPVAWFSVVGGLLTVWILSIPWRKMRTFKAHEARPKETQE